MTRASLGGLIAALWLSSPQVQALDLEFKGAWRNEDARQVEKVLDETWQIWAMDAPKLPTRRIQVVKASGSKLSGWGAQSTASLIVINEKFLANVSLLKHELAHVWWLNKCEAKPNFPEWVWETLAQWQSGDYRRISALTNGFVMASDAARWLEISKWQNSKVRTAQGQKALARLLTQVTFSPNQTKALESTLKSSFCEAENSKNLPSSLHEILLGKNSRRPAPVADLIIWHELTGEVLFTQGKPDLRTPHGSIMKPFLVSFLNPLKESRLSRDDKTWLCPNRADGHLWTWQESLSHSCNGFFLDHSIEQDDLSRFSGQLAQVLDRRIPNHTLPSWLGLDVGSSFSLAEIYLLYRRLRLNDPDVLLSLKETWKSGTLSHSSEASWFRERNAIAKTGTVRSVNGDPEWSWIMTKVELPQGTVWALGRAQERASQTLVKEIKARLIGIEAMAINRVTVQVLGLAPPQSLSWRCDDAGWANHDGEIFKAQSWQPLFDHGNWSCLRGPLTVRVPTRAGWKTKEYWGVLSRALEQKEINREGLITEKQARARRGSTLWLTTSERQYLAGVLASEFAAGREATLKILAVAARTLLHGRHGGNPPCDTTHCQVFESISEVSDRDRQKYLAVADGVKDWSLKGNSNTEMIEYSTGGTKPWRKFLNADVLKLKFGPSPWKLNKYGEKWAVNGDEWSCEKFRSNLHLPSCPLTETQDPNGIWFSGVGEGHGRGIDLTRLDSLAASGLPIETLVERVLGGYRLLRLDSSLKSSFKR